MNRILINILTLTLFLGLNSSAIAEPNSEISLTVYSNADPTTFDPQQFIAQQVNGVNTNWSSQVPGFGVVKELRTLDLQSGLNEVKFTDVAQFIDPTTVSFSDITDPKTSIFEQNFQFDLANSEKVLKRYLDKEIGVVIDRGNSVEEVKGVLVSAVGGQLVLKTTDGVQLLNRNTSQIKLGDLPGGLITQPTLVWKINTKQSGKHQVRTTYQTEGITWRSDYNLIVNDKDTAADIGAWVTLMNLSGMEFKNAALKLIAGDVQRITRNSALYKQGMVAGRMALAAEADTGFTEKQFFEYHLYSLPRRLDIQSNSTQQITLFPTAKDVKVEKLLVYYGLPESSGWNFWDSPQVDRNLGTQSNTKLDVYLRFKNDEANNMGMPLPRGKVRVYKQDSADGTLEFIGEDLIDHTPRDEKVMIKLGQSFDVVGERTQTNFTIDTNAHRITESFKITLKNHKDVAQPVVIKENLFRWSTWEITEKSDPFEKVDSRTIHFNVDVPARGEKTVTYTVKYSW